MEGMGVERGSGETSSFDAAEGRTSLIRSSLAKRSSFMSRSLPIALEDVSVESEARTRTGIEGAVFAVLGLNRSCGGGSAPARTNQH